MTHQIASYICRRFEDIRKELSEDCPEVSFVYDVNVSVGDVVTISGTFDAGPKKVKRNRATVPEDVNP